MLFSVSLLLGKNCTISMHPPTHDSNLMYNPIRHCKINYQLTCAIVELMHFPDMREIVTDSGALNSIKLDNLF